MTIKLCECGCGEQTKISPRTCAHHGWVKGEPRRFVKGHNARMSIAEKFWSKVQRTDECWLWTGAGGGHGYGTLRHRGTTLQAHRVSYELNVGPIPEGLHIDHLCRVRLCVNPAHLEAVTQKENNRRMQAVRSHCPHGHLLDGFSPSQQRRYCKTCKREHNRRRRGVAA